MTLVMTSVTRSAAALTAAVLLVGLLSGCRREPTEVTFELTGNDAMKFNLEQLEIDAPAKVTISLKNVGSMPKVAMGHTLVLLRQGVDALEFASECISKGAVVENEFLPEELRGKALGWTKVLGPGEQDTLVVDVQAPGTYAYVCTFPGHFVNMKGVLVAR